MRLLLLLVFYTDLLTPEKTQKAVDLWHWRHLKPPQARKIDVCTFYLYAIHSHVLFFSVPQPLSRSGRERRPSDRVVAQSKLFYILQLVLNIH